MEAMILILRHGQAKAKEEDPQRGLSDRGRSEVERVAGALSSFLPPLAEIRHSGKLRAGETALIMARAVGAEKRVRAHPGLDPDDPASAAAAELEAWTGNLAVVGHLPHLNRLISLLLTGRDTPELFHLPAAGAVCLEREQGLWRVRWMLTPETCGR
jgi:phosphohistidine phosphatase